MTRKESALPLQIRMFFRNGHWPFARGDVCAARCWLALGAWLLQRKASARAESAINDRYAHEAISTVDQFVSEEGRWPRSWSKLRGGPMRVMSDREKAEMRRPIFNFP